MALPKLNNTLQYEMTIPSSGKKVRYRPFLVKEEKNLMIAMESKDTSTIIHTLLAIIKECVEDDIVEFIAYSINSNVRELEGALISILAQSSLNKKEITMELVKSMVDKFVKSTTREISIDFIQKVVCDYFDMPLELLKSKTRKREIVQARQLSMYFSKQLTKNSLASIGQQCGNKDHATVLHACRTVNNLKETDKRFKTYVDDLQKRLTLA